MGQNKEGAIKARNTCLKKDPNYYATIGAKGGRARVSKGFDKMDREKRSNAGRLGGSISRKGPKLTQEQIKRIKNPLTVRDDIVALHEDEEAEKDLLITDKGWYQYIPKDEIEPVRSHWWQRRKI